MNPAGISLEDLNEMWSLQAPTCFHTVSVSVRLKHTSKPDQFRIDIHLLPSFVIRYDHPTHLKLVAVRSCKASVPRV